METVIQLNSGAKLSPHFTLGEMTRSESHPEVYNIPSHEAIANLKHLCEWLEVLRERYNAQYVLRPPLTPPVGGGQIVLPTNCPPPTGGDRGGLEPIRINSAYRSPQLNRKIGGAANSNHLTGCAADIRVTGLAQAIRYAAILLDYADESKQDFDELLIEKNRYGAIWLHFAVRFRDNRRKVLYINA